MDTHIFHCQIDNVSQVYDGDTIKDVRLEVYIESLDVGCFRTADIRIYGIDTPERRPRKAGRTEESRAAEKAAAAIARQAVIDILAANDYKFQVINVKDGKYAGRLIGTVLVGTVNLAQHLIKEGHAKPYFGGKRPPWNY